MLWELQGFQGFFLPQKLFLFLVNNYVVHEKIYNVFWVYFCVCLHFSYNGCRNCCIINNKLLQVNQYSINAFACYFVKIERTTCFKPNAPFFKINSPLFYVHVFMVLTAKPDIEYITRFMIGWYFKVRIKASIYPIKLLVLHNNTKVNSLQVNLRPFYKRDMNKYTLGIFCGGIFLKMQHLHS